jgi:two-component system response regulator FixJ
MSAVALIDDDPGVLDAVGMLLETKGIKVSRYTNAADFLSAPQEPGCVVSDLRMPGLNGMELLAAMQQARDLRPVILLTAHGDVELAVQALKRGASDFIEKPFEEDRLLAAIRTALEANAVSSAKHEELQELRSRYETLTERQRQVLWLVVEGCANKEVAARLSISVRTVETYRAWVLERMRAESLADLVRMAMLLRSSADLPQRTPVPSRDQKIV